MQCNESAIDIVGPRLTSKQVKLRHVVCSHQTLVSKWSFWRVALLL